MKASRIAAVGIVAAAGLWIASGHFLPHESAHKQSVRAQRRRGEEAVPRRRHRGEGGRPCPQARAFRPHRGRPARHRHCALGRRAHRIARAPRRAGEAGRHHRRALRRCAQGAGGAGGVARDPAPDRAGGQAQADRVRRGAEARTRQSRGTARGGRGDVGRGRGRARARLRARAVQRHRARHHGRGRRRRRFR